MALVNRARVIAGRRLHHFRLLSSTLTPPASSAPSTSASSSSSLPVAAPPPPPRHLAPHRWGGRRLVPLLTFSALAAAGTAYLSTQAAPNGKKNQPDDKKESPCWKDAPEVEGRDPTRWRYDIAGKPVLHKLKGTPGIFGYEEVLLKPNTKGNNSPCEKCIIAQSGLFVALSNLNITDPIMLKDASIDDSLSFSEHEKDLVETSIYGSINRPGRVCKVRRNYEENFRRFRNWPFFCGKSKAADRPVPKKN